MTPEHSVHTLLQRIASSIESQRSHVILWGYRVFLKPLANCQLRESMIYLFSDVTKHILPVYELSKPQSKAS